MLGSYVEARHNFNTGHPIKGTFYTAMAISDIALIKSAGVALGKLGFKLFAKTAADQTAEAFVKDFAAEAGTQLIGTGDDLARATNWVNPVDGYFDVLVHGTQDGTQFAVLHNGELVNINHRSLATFIEGTGYQGGPIRLLSCYSGSCTFGAAQNLSNKLGVEVLAPSGKLWIWSNGKMVIGESKYANTGTWNTFVPKKP